MHLKVLGKAASGILITTILTSESLDLAHFRESLKLTKLSKRRTR